MTMAAQGDAVCVLSFNRSKNKQSMYLKHVSDVSTISSIVRKTAEICDFSSHASCCGNERAIGWTSSSKAPQRHGKIIHHELKTHG
jgi:heterodisulfide reductase subunit B